MIKWLKDCIIYMNTWYTLKTYAPDYVICRAKMAIADYKWVYPVNPFIYDDFNWKKPFGLHGLYENISALSSGFKGTFSNRDCGVTDMAI